MANRPPETDSDREKRLLRDVAKDLHAEFNRLNQHHAQRGAALAVVARLDEALKNVITERFVDDRDVRSQMMSEMGPLGSFGARIRLAYLLDILSKEMFDAFVVIGKVRNLFAHSEAVEDFTANKVISLMQNIDLFRMVKGVAVGLAGVEEKKFVVGDLPLSDNSAYIFCLTVESLTSYLSRHPKKMRYGIVGKS